LPRTRIVFYQESPGDVPVVDFLRHLRARNEAAYARCTAAIRRLADMGHELRRPTADYLRDGIYELRAKCGRVNYRILYFFHDKQCAVLGHALTKEDRVPAADIERARQRLEQFQQNPAAHTYEEELQ
jgi:phage-related protein